MGRVLGVGDRFWRRNLWVCLLGSFTTVSAMTLLLPFLPLYVAQLGVRGNAAIVQWSGVAYGATFFAAALVAPLWGRLADRYGRKLMLVRASLGMAVSMSLIGMTHDVWQLVALRLLAGFAGGYASGSTVLVATQTPANRTGWALGMLSSGIMAGNLVGPLVGGILPPLIGIRATFWLAGGVIFLSFVATSLFIREDRPGGRVPLESRGPELKAESPGSQVSANPRRTDRVKQRGGWAAIPDKRPIVAMLLTGMLLMFATMSIEPIITVYVAQLVRDPSRVTLVAGLAMSAAALGSIISASQLGKLADRVGHWNVIVASLAGAALLLIPQAFVTTDWQLVGLRFLMGVALGGLAPCITSVIRHNVPGAIAGNIIGYSTSAQYVGMVVGPLAGGFVGGHFGMRPVFLATCGVLAGGALLDAFSAAGRRPPRAARVLE